MKDIAPELLEKLQLEFSKKYASNSRLKVLEKALEEGGATYKEANEYSQILGDMLADVYKNNISQDILPEGKMWYNIAKRVIEPTLKQNYEFISEYSKEVQGLINAANEIRIKPIKAPLNQDRIDGIINRITSENEFDKIKWILDEPVTNFSQSIVDDTIKTNAEFHYTSGLEPKIERKETGKCCDWCKSVVGVYKYPNEVPKDVYKRHRYCRCTVEYVPGNGRRQNVHTKALKNNNETLKDFRTKQINDIIESKKKRDIEKTKKAQRIIKDKVLGKKVNNIKIENVSEHFAERLIQRDLSVEDIINVVNKPLELGDIKQDSKGRTSFKVIGEKATIYINPNNGNITTVHKTGTKTLRKILEGVNEDNIK